MALKIRERRVRERTLHDYKKHYGYFVNWIREIYPEITSVVEITPQIVRDHVNYMRYDQKRYSGHKYINSENKRVGLSDTTVNIRLRTLKRAVIHYRLSLNLNCSLLMEPEYRRPPLFMNNSRYLRSPIS